MTEIKGYKATMPDGRSWYNPNMPPYEVGGTYRHNGSLVLCGLGLHFCRKLENVYVTYLESYQTRVFEVTASGHCLENDVKCCTDRLRVDRELSPREILEALLASGTGRRGHGVLFDIVWQTVPGVSNPVYAAYDVSYDAATLARMTERKRLFADAATELGAVDERMGALLEDVEVAVARERGDQGDQGDQE